MEFARSDFECQFTPNPRVRKFSVVGGRKRYLTPSESGAISKIKGVESVFLSDGFVSVHSAEPEFKDPLSREILDYLDNNAPHSQPPEGDREGGEGPELRDPLVREIISLLDTRVRPAVAADGGDVSFHSFSDGVLTLNMLGACRDCPSSTATLQLGIGNLFRQLLPEVREVRGL